MAGARILGRRARAELKRWLPTLPAVARAALRRTVWSDPPIALVGMPVDPEAVAEHLAWLRQLREYVNAHEEVEFYLKERTFHICRAHAAARRVVEGGVIPAGFRCPRGAAACPLATAAACVPGQAVLLVPRRREPRAGGGVHGGCAASSS
jgi:hypothetical protein